MGRRNKFTRKLCAGFVLLIMVTSVFSGAISATNMDTNSNNLPIDKSSKTKNTEFSEGKDSKLLPYVLQQTQVGVLSYSYDSDFLKIKVGEQYSGSTYGLDWTYLYDPVGHPDEFIHSIYKELYAVATNNWDSVKWSTSFAIDTSFGSEEAPDTATLHYGDLKLTRQVNPPVGSAKSFSITVVLTNTGDSTLENVRFFQGIDYDIGGSGHDYAWYTEATDTVWQNDDNYFKNGFHGSRTSSHHDCNGYTSMWGDISSGQLNDLPKYPEAEGETRDCGIALQWDAGDLLPQASWDLTITFYFGEAAGIEANAGPDQNVGRGQSVTFDASGSSSVGNITTYEWDFDNDGIYDVSVDTPIYVYEEGWTELGEYIVGLRVTDDEGRNDTDTVKITVVPNVDLTVTNITFTPTEINDGDIMIFNATVENIGTEALTDDFYVRFEVDENYIGRQQVSGGLAAGNSVHVLQNWEADAGTHTVSAYADRGYYSSENNLIPETNETNNTLSHALPEILHPDLTITRLTWSPTEGIGDGDIVIFNATVNNTGAGNTTSDFYVRFEIDDSYIGYQRVSGLAAGGSTEVLQSWHADAGTHTVKAVVDYYNEITESNETNNELSQALPEILFPDLTVTDISWSPPTNIKHGDTVTFTATIENIEAGNTSRNFYVLFEIDGSYIGHRRVSGLTAGSSTEVMQDWTADAGTHTVKAIVDEYDVVTESNESNNEKSEVLPEIPQPPQVNVTSPNGGEIWYGAQDITWEATSPEGLGLTIKIELYNGYSYKLIADGLPNTGTYQNWDTAKFADASSVPDSTYYKIRITATDTAEVSGSDLSDNWFTIWNTPIVEISSAPYSQRTTENVNATYTLTILNKQPSADTFDLSVDNTDNAAVAGLSQSSITLDPWESGMVTLNITDETSGTYGVTAKAVFQTNASITGEVTITTYVRDAFTIAVSTPRTQTSIGGSLTYKVEIANNQGTSDTFTLTVTGIEGSWCSMVSSCQLTAGETKTIPLEMSIPDTASAGEFSLTIQATSSNLGTTRETSAPLNVSAAPLIFDLTPTDNTHTGATEVLFCWRTSVTSTSDVFIKAEGEVDYTLASNESGIFHAVPVSGLSRNIWYDFYVRSNSTHGSATSEVRSIFIDNGITFSQRNYEFTIERDYNQERTITIVNTDDEPHEVLLNVSGVPEDLALNFVGEGSMDQVIPLHPGESKNIAIVFHAQDAQAEEYTILFNLTNLGAEEITDFAYLKLHVHFPQINFTIEEIESDPNTLAKTFRVVNHGDPITDFSLVADENLSNLVIFQPQIGHCNLWTGRTLEFTLNPILSIGFTGLSGNIIATGCGVKQLIPVEFIVPEGKSVYTGTIGAASDPYIPVKPVEAFVYAEQLPESLYVWVDAIFEHDPSVPPIFMLDGVEQNGNEIVLYVHCLAPELAGETNVSGEYVWTVLDIVEPGVYNISVREKTLDIVLATEVFTVKPYAVFIDEDGLIGTLEIYRGDLSADPPYVIHFPGAICTPVMFNYTNFWACSLDYLILGINLTTTSPKSNVTLSISAPTGVNISVNPQISDIGTLAETDMILVELETSNVIHGTYNLCYTLYYTENGIAHSISGAIPVGIYELSSAREGDSVHSQITTPFGDVMNFTSSDWVDLSIQGRNISMPWSYELDVTPSNFTLAQPGNPFPLAFLLAAITVAGWVNCVSEPLAYEAGTWAGGGKADWERFGKDTIVNLAINAAFTGVGKGISKCATWTGKKIAAKKVFNHAATRIAKAVRSPTKPQLPFWKTICKLWESGKKTKAVETFVKNSIDKGGFAIGSNTWKIISKTMGKAHTVDEIGNIITGLISLDVQAERKGGVIVVGERVVGIELVKVDVGAYYNSIMKQFHKTYDPDVDDVILEETYVKILQGLAKADSDGDGYSDLDELGLGTDPLDPKDSPGVSKGYHKNSWHCTNRPKVMVGVDVEAFIKETVYASPPVPNVKGAYLITRFTLGWAERGIFKPHNVHILINDHEIGSLIDVIPEGQYIFEFDPSILNYAQSGVARNTITLDTEHLNGGHYVISSDIKLVLDLGQVVLPVVASSQAEADEIIEGVAGTVARQPDLGIYPEDMSFSDPKPEQEDEITIDAMIHNLGCVGASVQVQLFDNGIAIEDPATLYVPSFDSQTVNVTWTATGGTHNICAKVNPDLEIEELDYTNNEATKTISVTAPDTGLPEISNLQPPDGSTVTDSMPLISADLADPGSGINTTAVRITVDGFDVTQNAPAISSRVWYTPEFALANGGHNVSVYAEDNKGNNNSLQWSFTVATEKQPPVASFTYSPENPAVNETITFNASNSYDLDGLIVNYEWEFGDGFNTTGAVVTHSYSSASSYYVILTVTDNDGAIDTEIRSITVSGVKTIYVDGDFTDDPANHRWDTIREGINDANDGDTVFVYTGTYYENVVLNKRLTLVGEGMPTIDAQSLGDAINIAADNCTVRGFSCINAHPSSYAGIRVESNNNVIKENTCKDNDVGIVLLTSGDNIIANNNANSNNLDGIRLLSHSNNNTLVNNIANSNIEAGILCWTSSDNIFTYNNVNLNVYGIWLHNYSTENILANNTAKNNRNTGIYLKNSNNNRIIDNDASNNDNYHGISLYLSNNNEVRNNVANYNYYQGVKLEASNENLIAKNTAKNNGNNGIYLKDSNNNEMANNTANSNNYDGIRLRAHSSNNIVTNNIANSNIEAGILCWTASDNILTYNNLSSNDWGIWLHNYSNENILANNIANSNKRYGIQVARSSNNNIYLNNFVDNTHNAHSYNSNNIWNSSEKISYTYNGNTYISYLGNYWSDYNGSDADGDGIGEDTYIIDGDKDYYPLMERFENLT